LFVAQGKQGQGYYLDKRHPGYKALMGVSGKRDKKRKQQQQAEVEEEGAAGMRTPDSSAKSAKKSKKNNKEEESRRVRFGQNIAKGKCAHEQVRAVDLIYE
jgi:hypothetical protein